jgi:hypothetical protein
MNMRQLVASAVLLCGVIVTSHAEEAAAPVDRDRWSVGASGGYFDMDVIDSAYFSSSSVGAFVGFEINRYFALELQVDYVDRGFDTDEDGFRSQFEGVFVSPSLVVKYPLDETLEVYARLGGSLIDYELANIEVPALTDDSTTQPMAGIGIRSKYLFLEYVNYGQLEEMYMEQLKAGFRFQF